MDAPLEYALRYLAAGWSVAPVRRDGRDPKDWKFPESWRRYQKTRPTESEVRQWSAGGVLQNIAVITGKISGIVVVDVDLRKGGSIDGLPPTGCIARTGGGGYHYVYHYPQLGHTITSWAANMHETDPHKRGRDVRADGGLIIAPPSQHESGGTYEWLEFDPERLGAPPEWALRRPEKPTKANGVKKEGKQWVASLIRKGTSVGSRNNDATRYAGYLASLRIPKDIAHAMLDVWMRDQSEPLSDDEVETIVESVYRTESSNKFNVLSLSDFMVKHGSTEVRWAVKDWWPESTIGFLVSPPAGYKTWLTYDLAASVASGRPFLGHFPVEQPGPVLIVQQEDFAGDIASRNGVVILNRLQVSAPSSDGTMFDVPIAPSNRDVPLFFHTERQVRFEDRNVMRKLHEFIVANGIKLCIIDPLYSAARTDDYMAEATRHMMQLKDTRDETGCGFLIVHHTRKSADSWDRQNLWGSQFVNAFSETSWHVRRVLNRSKIVLQRHFKTASSQPFTELTFDIDIPSMRYAVMTREVTEEEAGRTAAGSTDDILDSLAEPATLAELAVIHGKSQAQIRKTLQRLINSGAVEVGADNKYRRSE